MRLERKQGTKRGTRAARTCFLARLLSVRSPPEPLLRTRQHNQHQSKRKRRHENGNDVAQEGRESHPTDKGLGEGLRPACEADKACGGASPGLLSFREGA
jgi:hypothetical protein